MNRSIPIIVFAIFIFFGATLTSFVFRMENAAGRSRFEVIANETVNRLRARVSQHIALLAATASFMEAKFNTVSKDEFARFVGGLDLQRDFEGVHGIGFAKLIATGSESDVTDELKVNYGLDVKIRPRTTNQIMRAPVTLLEPQDIHNRQVLGDDLFASDNLRPSIALAINSGDVQASAPVTLAQDAALPRQHGFFVFDPLPALQPNTKGLPRIRGFVYATFRAGDLHAAVLENQFSAVENGFNAPVELETIDTTGDRNVVLYKSANFDSKNYDPAYLVERKIEIAGRTWTIELHENAFFGNSTSHLYSIIIAIISVFLAVTIAGYVRAQQRVITNTKQLSMVSQKSELEKELLLQEMKHRIKNSIARILAIARGTATSANSLDQFVESFTARLEAMAKAQDMLTQSWRQSTDLEELVREELEQVFGDDLNPGALGGPKISLNEKQTRALGLTFHELATNALKYGAGGDSGACLTVRWHVTRKPHVSNLIITWTEVTGEAPVQPDESGFGTRLIDANVKGELMGSVEREFGENGMTITMTIPFESEANGAE